VGAEFKSQAAHQNLDRTMAFSERVQLISQCRALRAEGLSFGEIATKLSLPKSTVHWHTRNIKISLSQHEAIEQRRQELCRMLPNKRKGKCIAGREVFKPESWTEDLVHVIAHLMFDGSVERYGCVYYNSSETNVDHVSDLLNKVFGVKAKKKIRDNSIYAVSAYYIELADYVREKERELLGYIQLAPIEEKKIFLQAFFDDEGSIYYKKGKRRIRGSQDSIVLLELVKKLLVDFNIYSRIDTAARAIEISGKSEILKFKGKINFSKNIFINSERKNSIWKQKLEKREILNKAVNSYLCST